MNFCPSCYSKIRVTERPLADNRHTALTNATCCNPIPGTNPLWSQKWYTLLCPSTELSLLQGGTSHAQWGVDTEDQGGAHSKEQHCFDIQAFSPSLWRVSTKQECRQVFVAKVAHCYPGFGLSFPLNTFWLSGCMRAAQSQRIRGSDYHLPW